MVGMALGGYLGGYIYDLSGSYVIAWLLSFASGLISSLLAMDLLAQMDRAKAASVQTKSDSPQPEQAASV
jgi:hypothetical protein